MDTTAPHVQLNILPVGQGDCLHLRFRSSDRWHNVIVDSGPAGTSKVFRLLLEQIKDHGEEVDLLCFSHIDDDHIKGAEKVFTSAKFDPTLIRQIWMNVPAGAIPEKTKTGSFAPKSVETAIKLLKAIVNHDIPFTSVVTAGMELTIGDARLEVVLPTLGRLQAYYEKWKKDAAIFQEKSAKKDTSETNGSSIALLCMIGSHRLLLVGDAFAEDLGSVGNRCAGAHGFSIVKLPHHGSDSNTTPEMIESLKTQELIISTSQTPYRPSDDAMKTISNYGTKTGGVTVYGNYNWSRFADGVQAVTIIHPQNKAVMTKDGIEVYSDGSSGQLFAETARSSDPAV